MGRRRVTLDQETSINETCIQEVNLDIMTSLDDTGEMPALSDEYIDLDIEEETPSIISSPNVTNFNYQKFVQTTELTQYIPLRRQIMEDDWKPFAMTTEIPADSVWMTGNNMPLPVVTDPTLTVTTVQPIGRKDNRLKAGMTINKGRRISVDDIVPMSGIDYDPMAGTTVIKVSNGDWVADAEYVLINYRILPSYFELQLETRT